MFEPAKTPQSTGFRRLVVMLAGVAVIAAVLVVSRDSFRPPESVAPSPPALEPEDSAQRAQRLGGVDSTKKNEWVDEIPGADLSRLDPARVEIFLRFANARRCTCGCGFTLAACRWFDPSCEVSGPLVEALLDSVAHGWVSDTRGLRKPPTEVLTPSRTAP
jgi:hypothetical protein